MSDLKDQIIEKSEQVAHIPAVQKMVSTYAVGAGSAFSLEWIQGWLGIISVIIGIVAGLFIIVINYRKSRGVRLDNEMKELIKIKTNLEIQALEDRRNGNGN